jgi:DASH complex subunit ASK1
MAPPLKPIEPKSTRWEPTADPKDIVVPGLDMTAPVNDQIDQIEQLITIKLQVRTALVEYSFTVSQCT